MKRERVLIIDKRHEGPPISSSKYNIRFNARWFCVISQPDEVIRKASLYLYRFFSNIPALLIYVTCPILCRRSQVCASRIAYYITFDLPAPTLYPYDFRERNVEPEQTTGRRPLVLYDLHRAPVCFSRIFLPVIFATLQMRLYM